MALAPAVLLAESANNFSIASLDEAVLANCQRRIEAAIAEILDAKQRLFNEERDRLEPWLQDKTETETQPQCAGSTCEAW